MLGRRSIQNEEIPAVFRNPKYRDSRVQLLEQTARGNRYTDVNSLALMISRPRPRITNWERGDLIGKGSFTSVYRGYSNEHGISFAAKGVSLSEHKKLRHLEDEIDILEGLDHENIIQCYGTHKDGEMLYIFLELASQGTLEQAYKKCRFTESQVSHYTRQILQGLTYLHSYKVFHGDLKCANILLTESGRIKLADFGLSNRREDHSYGFPSDICSLGCTVLEMSTGEYPQCNAKKVFISEELAIRSGRGIIVPRNLPRNLRDFIIQCLQLDPNQRPTAAELLAHPFVKESSCPQPDLTVSSQQAAAVFSNPNYRASPVQIARINLDSDAKSPARTICTPRPEITDWDRGVLIGKGSFASVYKGYSKEHKLFFAAKAVSPTEHNHLPLVENEIAILKLLDYHENIIQCYGTLNDGEMVYIFLELASQGTLEQAYKNCRFTESRVSDYTRQILQGLTYLHSYKVVHGDLKCANILVTESGRLKLADFGLSKRMEDHSYGFPSDICSLGFTVLEMSTFLAIRSGRGIIVPRNPPRNLRDFINQCLQPDPKQRPTAAELLAHPFVNESSLHADS